MAATEAAVAITSRRSVNGVELVTRHDKVGSGEVSLAGSTKGVEDDWVSSSTGSIAQLYGNNSQGQQGEVQQLRLYEKILYGMGASFAFNALVVTNGTLIDYYEDTYQLDSSFLGLTNFFAGLLTIFATLGFGVLSDSSPKTRWGQRKPYIAILTPVLALSIAALYAPRLVTNRAMIPSWFAGTFIVSQVTTSAIMVVIAAWGVGLTREAEDRGGLYLVDAVLDLLGFLTGVIITSYDAEKEGGKVLAAIFIVQNALMIRFVPTEPGGMGLAETKVPFIAGLHLSLQNQQFMSLLWAASFGSIIATTVNLLPLFLQIVMGVPDTSIDDVYAQYVEAVVAVAFVTIFLAQPLNRRLGRIQVLKIGVFAGIVYGLLALALSFSTVNVFYLTVVPAGIFGGIVMVNGNVLLCNSIDYDELMTGYRRRSFHQCLIYAPVTFFGVAGSSIPLSIISAIGNTDVDGQQPSQVVMVLRLWVTLCVSLALLASYWCVCSFQLTEEVQHEIFLQLQRRESGEVFPAVDPLDLVEGESASSNLDMDVLPPPAAAHDGSSNHNDFIDLYFRDSEVVQLLDRHGKLLCLFTYGFNLVLMTVYTLLLLWRTITAIQKGNTTRAMLKSCLLMLTALNVLYEACRLPAFLWVYRSVDRDLIKWARQLMNAKNVRQNVARSRFGNASGVLAFHLVAVVCIAIVVHYSMI